MTVRIKGFDDKPLDNPPKPWSKEDSQVCFPFLPLHINIIPKKGETAKVILFDIRNDQYVREYVGPLVPQLGDKLKESPNFPDARRGRPDYSLGYEQSINKIVTAEGVYPKKDEIAIQGRDNTDIIFKPSEVLIRTSKFLPNQPTVRNDINPGYIQLKTITPGKFNITKEIESTTNTEFKNLLNNENGQKIRTDINLVSNKIYLIGRDDNSSIIKPYFNEEEEVNIEDKLHPIVYGDILQDFIELLYKWINSHVHPYHGKPPNEGDQALKDLKDWKTKEFPKLNSKNIFAGGDFESTKSLQAKITLANSRGTGTSDIGGKLVGEEVIRDNSSITRVSDALSSLISIDAVKVCDGTICKVDFDIINNSNGDIIVKLDGTGVNENDAYQNVVTILKNYLAEKNIPLNDVYIPKLNEIKVF